MTLWARLERLERLERRPADPDGVNWGNLLARGPAEIVPDGIVDWEPFFQGAREAPDPVEAGIAAETMLSDSPNGLPTGGSRQDAARESAFRPVKTIVPAR